MLVEMIHVRPTAVVAAELRAAYEAASKIFLLREELAAAQAEEDREEARRWFGLLDASYFLGLPDHRLDDVG